MKGKELFTEDHAERIKKSSVGKPYRPSNGTEGALFMGRFCDQCTEDNLNDIGEGGCKIILLSMSFDVDESGYPKEWVYDKDGQPICTAWKQREKINADSAHN